MSLRLGTRQALFRYASEWDPKKHAQTKGGYIEGEIELPKIKEKVMKMTIETCPTENVPEIISNLHPLILHLVRMGKGRREQDKEPVPNCKHWKLDFIIEHGKSVFIENQTSDLDVDEKGTRRKVPSRDLITQVKDNKIQLNGHRGNLSLVVLTPKQDARARDANSGEATVGTVLADRARNKSKKQLAEMVKTFKNAYYMKKVHLKVRFYTKGKGGQWVEVASSLSSQPILDIGNKVIGALELHDVTPLKSCARGGRKVVMISEYELAENTVPIFQVWDQDGVRRRADLDHLLVQPSTGQQPASWAGADDGRGRQQAPPPRTLSLRKNSILFLTPAQPRLAELAGMRIKLTLRREGDSQLANNAFDFRYVDHLADCCLFCYECLDSDQAGPASLVEPLAKARPGHKKKLINSLVEAEAAGEDVKGEGHRKPSAAKRKAVQLSSKDERQLGQAKRTRPTKLDQLPEQEQQVQGHQEDSMDSRKNSSLSSITSRISPLPSMSSPPLPPPSSPFAAQWTTITDELLMESPSRTRCSSTCSEVLSEGNGSLVELSHEKTTAYFEAATTTDVVAAAISETLLADSCHNSSSTNHNINSIYSNSSSNFGANNTCMIEEQQVDGFCLETLDPGVFWSCMNGSDQMLAASMDDDFSLAWTGF